MATLTAGYSFGATETCTNTKLGQLVSNGSVSSITQTDIAAGEGLVYVGTSAPSDTDRVWVDTNSTPVILRFYNSNLSAWVTPGELALYTNKSSQTGAVGRVLILDTSNSNSYTYTSTAGDTKFIGIETGTIAANATAPIISRGVTTVLLEMSASAGTYLRTSTATGKAEPCVNSAAGIFGFLTESGTASGRSNIFGVQTNSSVDQTSNYTWTGTHTYNGVITLNSASGTTSGWLAIAQIAYAASAGVATGSTAMPDDDTIPQSGEGNEYMSVSITPKSVNNILFIEAEGVFDSSANLVCTMALFQDATANALAAVQSADTGAVRQRLHLKHRMLAGTTSSTTFKIRAGFEGGTTTFNGSAAGRKMGGVMNSYIMVTEIKG